MNAGTTFGRLVSRESETREENLWASLWPERAKLNGWFSDICNQWPDFCLPEKHAELVMFNNNNNNRLFNLFAA